MMFDIPTDRCHVIKNGVTNFPKREIYKQGNTLRIIHQNTPWRGLNVLLAAMQHLKGENITHIIKIRIIEVGKPFIFLDM